MVKVSITFVPNTGSTAAGYYVFKTPTFTDGTSIDIWLKGVVKWVLPKV